MAFLSPLFWQWILPPALTIVLLAVISTTARLIHVSLFEKHFKITFADAPVRSLFYFGTWSFVVWFLYPGQIRILFAHVTIVDYIAMALMMLVFFPWLYHATRKKDGNPQWLLSFFPGQGMLTLGERYILAKIADVIFQQLIAGVMILTLVGAGVQYPVIVIVFVTLFALAHVYLFKTSGMFWGIYYTTYAALGAFAFTFFIIFIPNGITYAILFHMLFYVLSGVLFAKLPRPSREVYHDLSGMVPEA